MTSLGDPSSVQATAAPTGDAAPAPVLARYLLVTSIPCYLDDADGSIWLERRWHRDLVEHLSYLRDMVVCAPRLRRQPSEDLVRLEPPTGGALSFRFLPAQRSFLRALLAAPVTAVRIARAVHAAEIVHSSVIGWPFPLGWITNPLAVLWRKRLIIVVESSWRLGRPGASLSRRLRDLDFVREWMARWSCRHADLALFTHSGYRDALCGPAANAHVAPATWVNSEDVLTPTNAAQSWAGKRDRQVRLLFAGRLTASKGVHVLLDALKHLEAKGISAAVDLIGEGDLAESCAAASAELRVTRLAVLPLVPYGPQFFALVRGYHAVLVPSLGDEQPRIVFDAHSQAVPVLAASTAGLRPHVEHGRTGWLYAPGDPEALAAVIERAGREPTALEAMGLQALNSVGRQTHKALHRARTRLIQERCIRGLPRSPS